MVLNVLLRQERPAGGDLADQRQHTHLANVRQRDGRSRGGALALGELEGPRLRRVAPQVSGPLEVGQVGVDGRRRGEPHRLADLAHGGRIPVRVHVADDELVDLSLTLREHLPPSLVEHLFVQGSAAFGRSQPAPRYNSPVHALVAELVDAQG
jgi:hypothetical protein